MLGNLRPIPNRTEGRAPRATRGTGAPIITRGHIYPRPPVSEAPGALQRPIRARYQHMEHAV